MSDLRAELEALRRDIEEIRAAMPGTRGRDLPPPHNPMDDFSEGLREELRKKGEKTGIGVMRLAVIERLDKSCRAGTTSNNWTSFESLPSEEKIIEVLEAYSKHPLTMRALYRLLRQFFEGQPMRLSRTELAESLGAVPEEVDRALLALVQREVVKARTRDSDDTTYELDFPDPFLSFFLVL